MSSVLPRAVSCLILLVVASLSASDLRAQEQSRPILLRTLTATQHQVVAAEQSVRNEEANALFAEAQAMESDGRLGGAASSYERVGLLRGSDDVRAVDAFAAAARLRYTGGDLRAAARLSELAANRALGIGEVYRAATSLRYASIIHTSMGNQIRAQELGWRSCRLSASPFLSSEQRDELQRGLVDCRAELQRLALNPAS